MASTSSRKLPDWGAREGVRRIAAQELRRTWRSYAATAAVNLLIGLVGGYFVWAVATSAAAPGSGGPFLTDLFLLLLVANLSLNWVSRNYLAPWEDPFSGWVGFLRTLPVPAREVVRARALIMTGTTAVMVVVFFLPVYLLNGGLREAVPAAEYLWFAVVWGGYTLVLGGMNLYLELGVHGKTLFGAQLVALVALVAVALLANEVLSTSIAQGVLDLAADYGPLPAAGAVATGLASMWLGQRATARRLQNRRFD